MGRNRKQNLDELVEKIFLSIELDNFEDFKKAMEKLLSIEFETLSEEDAKFLYGKIESIENKIREKQEKLAKKIQNMSDIKKFRDV
ncbi:MAG: hypothetical protein D6831_00400 [Aquificota bacterium]|nr:MAG: hypothetical protein D6831_00400 [Aquificota bacterium]